MKKLIIILVFQLGVFQLLFAQTLTNYGANMTIKNGSTISILGDFNNLDDAYIGNSGVINISGNWINNTTSGNLLEGTIGNVVFNGFTSQNIEGSNRTFFSRLHIQNNVILHYATSVSSNLFLTAGSVDINNQILIMQSGSIINNANESNYIIADGSGRLIREVGNWGVVFPVGTEFSFTPIIINNSGTIDYYSVNVFDDVLEGGTTGLSIPEIDNCVNLSWDINELTNGGSNLSITAIWNSSDEGIGFDRTLCGIGHYNNGSWIPQEGQSAAGANPYLISRSGITELSAFAVGDINSPMAIVLDLEIDIWAFLEGPFNGTFMESDLNAENIPLSQPYNVDPWNYSGTESVPSIPNPIVVDWVLIEIRDAADVASATQATTIAKQAAFVLKNGNIVGINGYSNLYFNNTINQELFVVVRHRNHLGIISADALTATGGIYTYDFRIGEDKVYGGIDGHKQISTEMWGMIAGDADANGLVGPTDNSHWVNQAGTNGYNSADYNMNTQVSNQDKNDYGIQNLGSESHVPD